MIVLYRNENLSRPTNFILSYAHMELYFNYQSVTWEYNKCAESKAGHFPVKNRSQETDTGTKILDDKQLTESKRQLRY